MFRQEQKTKDASRRAWGGRPTGVYIDEQVSDCARLASANWMHKCAPNSSHVDEQMRQQRTFEQASPMPTSEERKEPLNVSHWT